MEFQFTAPNTQQLPRLTNPFHLNHVLHAPKIIKNLISVRRLTTDNNVSVSFDSFGFTVSDWWVKPQVHGSTKVVKIKYRSNGELFNLINL